MSVSCDDIERENPAREAGVDFAEARRRKFVEELFDEHGCDLVRWLERRFGPGPPDLAGKTPEAQAREWLACLYAGAAMEKGRAGQRTSELRPLRRQHRGACPIR